MRISLVGLGSRGDVQPFVALGACLRSRGHDVDLASTAEFEGMSDEAGLRFRKLPGNPTEILNRPEVIAAIRKGPSAIRIGMAARKYPRTREDDPYYVLGETRKAMEGADVVVGNWMTKLACLVDLKVPWCTLNTSPRVPTREFPAPGWPRLRLGGMYNRFSHRVWGSLEWLPARRSINRLRADVGQSPLGMSSPFREVGERRLMLLPFSPEVVSRPADWPAEAQLSGFLFWDRDQPIDPGLAKFVETNPNPVVLALGSTWNVYPEEPIIPTVLSSARRAGRPIVLAGGQDHYAGDDVYCVHQVEYSWLFSKAGAVIHHGGLGTTAEAMRAGVPQVVMPSISEQPFWASAAQQIGVAPTPVPLKRLTADKLSRAIDQCLGDPGMAERAKGVGAKVSAEDGNGVAAKALEDWAAARP